MGRVNKWIHYSSVFGLLDITITSRVYRTCLLSNSENKYSSSAYNPYYDWCLRALKTRRACNEPSQVYETDEAGPGIPQS